MDVKILDGGFSTQLSRYVGEKVDGDPLWTAKFLVTNPDAVIKTHLDFLRAGSDIIETNTYQASVSGFMKYMALTEDEAKNVIATATALAKSALNEFRKENPDTNVEIFGSIGPYGAALHDGSEYTGSYGDIASSEVLCQWHKPRLEILLENGIHNFAIETIPCEKEALVLAEMIKDYPSVKAWISLSCKDDTYLANGEIFHEVAKRVYLTNPSQIIAVGVNCLNPLFVKELLKSLNGNSTGQIPLVVYPNSGEKYVDGSWKPNAECKLPLEDFVEEWVHLGVKYIGGCCRTTAEDIKAIKNRVSLIKSNLTLKQQ